MDFFQALTFGDAITYAAYFVLAATILHSLLPPKELVYQYFPNAKWYGFIVDVVTRWASGDVKSKLWDLKKHMDNLEKNK